MGEAGPEVREMQSRCDLEVREDAGLSFSAFSPTSYGSPIGRRDKSFSCHLSLQSLAGEGMQCPWRLSVSRQQDPAGF